MPVTVKREQLCLVPLEHYLIREFANASFARKNPQLRKLYSFLALQRLSSEEGTSEQGSLLKPDPIPSLHRTIVARLLQDLFLWWIETDQTQTFSPEGIKHA